MAVFDSLCTSILFYFPASLFLHKPPSINAQQLLYTAGLLFMGATEEQMALLSRAGVSHVSYILVLYSIAFLLFLFVCLLLHLYATHTWPVEPKASRVSGANGVLTNGHPVDARRMRDAEEFELEGLMSDDEDGSPAGKVNGHAN